MDLETVATASPSPLLSVFGGVSGKRRQLQKQNAKAKSKMQVLRLRGSQKTRAAPLRMTVLVGVGISG
jgi:hypothetical protein